jgi:alkaline phosphatase
VGHEFRDIQLRRTLQAMYLDSLAFYFSKNGNTTYPDTGRSLILLIDIKTGAVPTIHRLVEVLQGYPQLIHSNKLQIIITGNRPAPDLFKTYPDFILFDGNIRDDYTTESLHKIGLMSDDFRKFSLWNGTGVLLPGDSLKLALYIDKIHSLHKKIRFWAAPDNENAWQQLIRLKVDYLNTDHIEEIAVSLKKKL